MAGRVPSLRGGFREGGSWFDGPLQPIPDVFIRNSEGWRVGFSPVKQSPMGSPANDKIASNARRRDMANGRKVDLERPL